MPVPLASLADVKRVLHRPDADTSIDGPLAAALETATAHVKRYLRQDFTQTAASTMSFYDIREDGMVPVPLEGSSVTAVRFYKSRSATAYVGVVLVDYEVQDGRYIRLHPTFFDIPFEGSVAVHDPGIWERIEVDYTPSAAQVPEPVRDGTAITAGAIYTRSPQTISGFTGEHIGDYSYQVRPLSGASGGSEAIPDMAKALLRPWKRRRSLVP